MFLAFTFCQHKILLQAHLVFAPRSRVRFGVLYQNFIVHYETVHYKSIATTCFNQNLKLFLREREGGKKRGNESENEKRERWGGMTMKHMIDMVRLYLEVSNSSSVNCSLELSYIGHFFLF